MEKIDLSTNAKAIEQAYLKVVRNDEINYLVLTVNKGSVVELSETGHGDLHDFVEHFNDGHVQFGLARVSVPGSDVFKNLLLGWCPDNAPAKARLSFAANFADIANVLQGYHVQITARDQDDLDVEEFLSRVSAAAGARYSIQTIGGASKPITSKPIASKPVVSKPIAPKPAVSASKPSFVPKSTGLPINVSGSKESIPIIKPKPAVSKPQFADDDDDWAGEKEIEERDFSDKPLEDVPSAYKPTKVNIEELRKQKSDTISSQPKPKAEEPKAEEEEPKSLKDRLSAYKKNEEPSDGRLYSLPKPKVSHDVSSRYHETSGSAPKFGSKPALVQPTINKADNLVGGVNRDFASENGKTPAQIWAEKRGKYKTVANSEPPVSSSSPEPVENIASTLKSTKLEEPESEEETPEPVVIKPATSFPPPPARSTPAKLPEPEEEAEEEEEEEEEQEEEEEETTPVPAPLPARNLPPPPVRNVAAAVPPFRAPAEEPKPEPVEEPSAGGVSAIAEYTYEKDEDNEIGFEEGDLIIEIDFVDDDWWSGKHSTTGEVGLFPSSYVVVKEESAEDAKAAAPAPPSLPARETTPAAAAGPTATAEFAYEKDEDNEITFDEGDEIVDIEFVDEDWWSGKHSKSGEVGLFPANYVKLNE